MKYDAANNEEEEGEQFDFDSGDEIPEADRQAAGAPAASNAGADATSGSGGSRCLPHSDGQWARCRNRRGPGAGRS